MAVSYGLSSDLNNYCNVTLSSISIKVNGGYYYENLFWRTCQHEVCCQVVKCNTPKYMPVILASMYSCHPNGSEAVTINTESFNNHIKSVHEISNMKKKN